MRLRLSEDEVAFREEMRTFFTTEIPQHVRETVGAGRHVSKDDYVSTMRIMNAAGLVSTISSASIAGLARPPI